MPDPFGLLIVDKPKGPTSHDVVGMGRKAVGIRKIGHTGTLDPMASGVLVLCIGKATRLAEYLTGHDKRYRATIAFGSATDTYDATGAVTATSEVRPSTSALEAALDSFRGAISQRPPAYSALRASGKRAHQLAREGKPIELALRDVTIHSIDILNVSPERVELDICCSTGTYVRSIAYDLGLALGTQAHLASLRRTACGSFNEDQATAPKDLADGAWKSLLRPPHEGLEGWPPLVLNDEQAMRVATGRRLPAAIGGPDPDALPPRLRAMAEDGALLGLLEIEPAAETYRPVKVFTTKAELESAQ